MQSICIEIGDRTLGTYKNSDACRVQSVFIALVGIIFVASFALVWGHGFIPTKPPPSADLIIDVYRAFVSPKPTEQFVFAILAGLVPILAYCAIFSPFLLNNLERKSLAIALPTATALMLYMPLVASAFTTSVIGEYDHPRIHGVLALLACTVIAALSCMAYAVRPLATFRSSPRWRHASLVLWICFLSAALLQLSAWRLVSVASVTRSGVWSTHADPVMYALSQVVAGKTLMVDLPSQYGLFPEIVGPLFKLIGLSVFKLSAFFAILQLASMSALFYVLSRLIKTKVLRLVVGLALVMVTFETTLFIAGIPERYFQYWPVRFFWPALSVLVFFWFTQRRTLLRAAAVSLVGVIGLLWNLDSGLFITVVFAAYLVARLITVVIGRHLNPPGANDPWTVQKYVIATAIHTGITVTVVTAFLVGMSWKAGESLNPFWLLEYQKIFYKLGLMMLPLPRRSDPWMTMLGLYLIGLLSSLANWRRRMPRSRDDLEFFLSMLGLGLFVYYEGRSHVLNLITVCWPAVMLCGIQADQILRAVRGRRIDRCQIILPVAAISFLLVGCGTFLYNVPKLVRDTASQFSSRGKTEEHFVQDEIDFIRRNSVGEQECLILSQRQGIYYAETKLASPVRGPGLVEILLKADEQLLVSSFINGRLGCVFYGVGGYTDAGLRIPIADVLARYVEVSKNPDNTMLYLRPKKLAPDADK
jgi:hypothetical protein